MSVDKEGLSQELTEQFGCYLYQQENPMAPALMDKVIRQYQTDTLFNRKVQSMVNAVMVMVERHTTE